jgi:hypothetical protein
VAGTSAPRPGTIRAQVIVTAGTQSAELLLDALPPLADRLFDVAGEPTFACIQQRLHVELTMPSSRLTAAAPAEVGATLNALADVLGADHGCVPTAVTVETRGPVGNVSAPRPGGGTSSASARSPPCSVWSGNARTAARNWPRSPSR